VCSQKMGAGCSRPKIAFQQVLQWKNFNAGYKGVSFVKSGGLCILSGTLVHLVGGKRGFIDTYEAGIWREGYASGSKLVGIKDPECVPDGRLRFSVVSNVRDMDNSPMMYGVAATSRVDVVPLSRAAQANTGDLAQVQWISGYLGLGQHPSYADFTAEEAADSNKVENGRLNGFPSISLSGISYNPRPDRDLSDQLGRDWKPAGGCYRKPHSSQVGNICTLSGTIVYKTSKKQRESTILQSGSFVRACFPDKDLVFSVQASSGLAKCGNAKSCCGLPIKKERFVRPDSENREFKFVLDPNYHKSCMFNSENLQQDPSCTTCRQAGRVKVKTDGSVTWLPAYSPTGQVNPFDEISLDGITFVGKERAGFDNSTDYPHLASDTANATAQRAAKASWANLNVMTEAELPIEQLQGGTKQSKLSLLGGSGGGSKEDEQVFECRTEAMGHAFGKDVNYVASTLLGGAGVSDKEEGKLAEAMSLVSGEDDDADGSTASAYEFFGDVGEGTGDLCVLQGELVRPRGTADKCNNGTWTGPQCTELGRLKLSKSKHFQKPFRCLPWATMVFSVPDGNGVQRIELRPDGAIVFIPGKDTVLVTQNHDIGMGLFGEHRQQHYDSHYQIVKGGTKDFPNTIPERISLSGIVYKPRAPWEYGSGKSDCLPDSRPILPQAENKSHVKACHEDVVTKARFDDGKGNKIVREVKATCALYKRLICYNENGKTVCQQQKEGSCVKAHQLVKNPHCFKGLLAIRHRGYNRVKTSETPTFYPVWMRDGAQAQSNAHGLSNGHINMLGPEDPVVRNRRDGRGIKDPGYLSHTHKRQRHNDIKALRRSVETCRDPLKYEEVDCHLDYCSSILSVL